MSHIASKEKSPGLTEENESHKSKVQSEKPEEDAFLSSSWFSSLSEAQLDMLVYLKELVIKQVQNTGHEDLLEEFDGKMIRCLGSVLFTYFKERMKEVSFESAELEDNKLPSPKRENPCQYAPVEDPGPSNVGSIKRKREPID